MAEDYDTRPVYDVARIGDRPREQPRYRPPSPPQVRRPRGDAASVMGIPERHLTPPVQQAIGDLMAEIDHLRSELDQHDHRETWLDDLAHHHPAVPLLNRRGLLRELGRVLAHMGQASVDCCLATLHVGGIEALRARRGLAAGDAALAHLASVIAGAVRQSDTVAALDGGEFAVVFTLAAPAAAEAKAAEIAARVNDPPFQWDGEEVRFAVELGLCELGAGETPERAIAAADEDRRARRRTFVP